MLTDAPRLFLTVLTIAGAFTMLVAMGLSIESHMAFIGSANAGIAKLTETLLNTAVLITYAFTLYVLFTVSLAERKNQLRIMSAAGTTNRQLLKGLLCEALALDAIGAALGISAGFLFSRLLLRRVDVPLQPALFGSDTVLLQSVLPTFLLAPAIMLLCAPTLLRQKQNKRRKKPRRRNKNPFKVRLIPRLFGRGGALEHALGKQQRRHRVLLVGAIVVNVAALFFVTAGFYVLSHSSVVGSDNSLVLSFNSVFDPDSANHANANQLYKQINRVLEDCRKEGLLQDYEQNMCIQDSVCVVDSEYLTDGFLSNPNNSIQGGFPLNSSQTFFTRV